MRNNLIIGLFLVGSAVFSSIAPFWGVVIAAVLGFLVWASPDKASPMAKKLLAALVLGGLLGTLPHYCF